MMSIGTSSAICIIGAIALVHVCLAQNSPQDYVKAHNVARAEVGVVPIFWNKTLAVLARKAAEPRIISCDIRQEIWGENAALSSYAFTGVDAVKLWADEKAYYNYNKNECVGRNCDHYAQVVWNKSVTVGCARSQCLYGYWFVTCYYYPEGIFPIDRPYIKP